MNQTKTTWMLGTAGMLVLCIFILQKRTGPAEPLVVQARPASRSEHFSDKLKPSVPQSKRTGPNDLGSQIGKAHLPSRTRWSVSTNQPESFRFAEWVERYLNANSDEKLSLEVEGSDLAKARRAALRKIIQSDPAQALQVAPPYAVRRALPLSITSLLEEPISARGSLEVFATLAEPGNEQRVSPSFRIATIGDRQFQAHVFGWRLGAPTRHDIPLNGVAIDEVLALSDASVRIVDSDEGATLLPKVREPICSVSGVGVDADRPPVLADVGGEPSVFCAPLHATQMNEQLNKAQIAGDSGGGTGEVAASAATEGTKRLLLIRVDFSDLPGAPFTDAAGINLVNGLNAFFRESSFGRSGFAFSPGLATNSGGSDLTPVLRLPQTAAYYGGNDAYLQLRSDARNAAVAAGYILSNYDYDIYCFGAVPGFYWAGLGYVGYPGVWIRNYFTVGVIGHELGHNYGLNHANYWDYAAGSTVEYGDIFDTMGSANGGANHFNARYKSYMNWVQPSEALAVSSSGTYRIYAHDQTNSVGQRMGLKIFRSATTNYWVEFRQRFTGNRWLMNGASIRWAGNGNERSQLIDTTPGSPDGKDDSALVVGRTFSDHAAGVHITTLRKGGTTPESLDIAVNLGAFPGNTPPSVAIDANALSTSPGSTVTFAANATDPQGDTLAYHWDFGDGSFGTNGTVAGKSWATPGEYVVRCTTSDMKGGVASDSVIVTVGTSSGFRISGQVIANGFPLEGVRVSASGVEMAYTDSDGAYSIVGLPPGYYTVTATLEGYSFSASGFANPVGIGPSVSNINFTSGSGPIQGSVTLSSPGNGSSHTAPSTLFLAALASPSSGRAIAKVEFYAGATKLGEDSVYPYTFSWSSPSLGTHSLTARATETPGGSVLTSTAVSTTILPSAPSITSQPGHLTVAAGSSATFSVSATGSNPLTYRWRLNGTNLSGANSSSLSLFNVQPFQEGGYSVVITNGGGSITSIVATLSVVCSYALSANSTSFGATGGAGNVDVDSQGGCPWSVATVPSWVTITSGNGGSGNGTVSYVVATNKGGGPRSSTMSIAGRNYSINQAAPDSTRPTIAFMTPAASATVTNSQITVTGTAADNDGVWRVQYRVGSNAFSDATGADDWTAPTALSPGTNIISVRAFDLSGNLSLTNTRTIFCSVPGSLNLSINGRGSVSGPTNGNAIGRVTKLTAIPSSGYVFSNWTGDISSVSPSLSFVMQSNLQVTANFVTNPFVRAKGDFNGLFYESNGVRVGRSGALSLKLTEKGNFTASLRLGTKRIPFSGRFDLAGYSISSISHPGSAPLTAALVLALDGSEQVQGTISDGHWTAFLAAERSLSGLTNPASQSGKYTFLLLGTPGASVAPEGDGFGTAFIDAKGSFSLKGSLAEKTPFSFKVPLSKLGQAALYVPLYAGRGALLGWVHCIEDSASDFDGVISWIKPATTAGLYSNGFTAESALVGSRYVSPGSTGTMLALSEGNVVLSGGDFPLPVTNHVYVSASGKVTNVGPAILTFTINPSSGTFVGHLAPGGATAVPFKGVALQKANYASGFFLGTNLSGRVSLEPSTGIPWEALNVSSRVSPLGYGD